MSAARETGQSDGEVLVVGTDAGLIDDIVRLAAAVGRTPVVVADLASAGALWRSARVAIVTASVTSAPMAERESVIVATYDGTESSAAWFLAHQVGAAHVAVLPDAESWLIETLDDSSSRRRATVVSVVGTRGGAGASTLAAALAVRAGRRGLRVLLIDGDAAAGGLDLVVGAETVEGLRWRELSNRVGRLPSSLLTGSLPQRHGIHLLSHERRGDYTVSSTSAAAVVESARRGFDLVVIDCPHSFDDVTSLLIATSDATVVLVPRDIRAVAAANRLVPTLRANEPPLLVTRAPAPGGVSAADIGELLGLEVFAEFAIDKALPAELERGDAPGLRDRSSVSRVADLLLDSFGAGLGWRAAS